MTKILVTAFSLLSLVACANDGPSETDPYPLESVLEIEQESPEAETADTGPGEPWDYPDKSRFVRCSLEGDCGCPVPAGYQEWVPEGYDAACPGTSSQFCEVTSCVVIPK